MAYMRERPNSDYNEHFESETSCQNQECPRNAYKTVIESIEIHMDEQEISGLDKETLKPNNSKTQESEARKPNTTPFWEVGRNRIKFDDIIEFQHELSDF